MNDDILIEVSDILQTFNIAEVSLIIKEQINGDDEFINYAVNHFRPLYFNYAKITKYDIDEETKQEAEDKFFPICEVFIEEISSKFGIEIDRQWLSISYNTHVPALTLALYSVFVLDLVNNVYDVVKNYIERNARLVYETFEDMKNKKDASTLVNKKNFSPEMTVIISNIYDITKWIFMNINEDDFFEYSDKDQIPLKLLKPLFEEGYLGGDFVGVISEMLEKNVTFNSLMGSRFVIETRTDGIKDFFK